MESQSFYSWFTEKRKNRDLQNQELCILAAKSIKDNLQSLTKVPKQHKWLLEKIQKQLIERGCVRESTLELICDEILHPTYTSGLRQWSKSSMKQSIESYQLEFLSIHGINLLSGKVHGVTQSGPKSIRMSKDGELVFGGKMNRNLHNKSFDSKLDDNNLVFQKFVF